MSYQQQKVYEITDGETLREICLTHLPLDKMAANLADDIFKYIFINK